MSERADNSSATAVQGPEKPGDEAKTRSGVFDVTHSLHRFGGMATLRETVERVRRIMRAETALIASLARQPQTLDWRAASVESPAAEEAALQLDGAQILERWREGAEVLWLEENAPAETSERDLLFGRARPRLTFLVAPLRSRDELIGALAVGLPATQALGQEDRQTFENLAALAALALDNILLFETVSTAKRVWEQTFDAIPDGIIVHDEELRIARCNMRAAEHLGLRSPVEAIGLTRPEAFARLFGQRAAAYHVQQNTRIASSFELQAEDGSRYLVSLAPLENMTGGRAWSVMTWSDVTEIAEMQDQLARSRRLAMVGQLAAGVAHEINNPLAAITTCAETMLLDVRESAEVGALAERHDWVFYLEEVVRQAIRGKGITRGLLDLSSQRRAERRSCDINQIASHCAKLYEQRAAAGVSLRTELDDNLKPVLTDEAMLRQVLDNLLSNALDATNGSGIVTLTTVADEERVRIEVTDTGHGIPPETLARIFEPFYTTKEVGRGSGLGLAISASLAEGLGGGLSVQSKEGEGSCFRLWIPHLLAPEEEERAREVS